MRDRTVIAESSVAWVINLARNIEALDCGRGLLVRVGKRAVLNNLCLRSVATTRAACSYQAKQSDTPSKPSNDSCARNCHGENDIRSDKREEQ